MKSIKLEGNCSNPTAINVCKRHLCTFSRLGLSSSPNHRLSCVIIDQSPYREFYHTSRYPLGGILHNSRYYLRAHFDQIEISPLYTIYIYLLYIRADYNDASSGFGLWAKTLRGQLLLYRKRKNTFIVVFVIACRCLEIKRFVIPKAPKTS